MKNENSKNKIIIKNDFHRTNKQRILHTIYLISPIIFSFGAYFLSSPVWTFFTKKTVVPEIFKFLCTTVIFLLNCFVIFFITRKIHPIMKITISDVHSQEN